MGLCLGIGLKAGSSVFCSWPWANVAGCQLSFHAFPSVPSSGKLPNWVPLLRLRGGGFVESSARVVGEWLWVILKASRSLCPTTVCAEGIK